MTLLMIMFLFKSLMLLAQEMSVIFPCTIFPKIASLRYNAICGCFSVRRRFKTTKITKQTNKKDNKIREKYQKSSH